MHDIELWRGQHAGIWYRLVLVTGYRLTLQVMTSMIGDSLETWQLEWAQ